MIKKKRIGITGGIGAGKSIVCSIISTMGYPVFYSDKAAKAILNDNKEVIGAVKRLFGTEAYLNGELNRSFIAQQVFTNQALLTAMNKIVHPAVREAFDAWADLQETTLVFNEAAILFETGIYKKYDAVVLVTASENTRIKRVMLRDGISEQAVKDRMAKQWNDDRKKNLADHIVLNDDNTMLIPQVITLLNNLKS